MKNNINSTYFKLLLLVILVSQTISVSAQGLNNGLIRSGNGGQNSINNFGNLNQPFYYNGNNSNWYKLTYSNYALDYALAVGGDGNSEWNLNGTTAINPTMSNQTIDASGFTTTGAFSGYGTLISRGNISVGGQNFIIEQTYALPQNSAYLQIKVKVTNVSATTATNVRVWVGTRDDWVGTNDGPTKTKGNLVNGAFAQITNVNEQSQAIKITSGQETVLVFSNSDRGYTISQQCCSFQNVINQNPTAAGTGYYNNLNGDSWTGDGSYGFYVRMNDLAANESDDFTWYYAAGSISDIDDIISEVAQAAGAIQDITCTGATYEATSSQNGIGYYLAVPANSTPPTAVQIKSGSNYGSVTVVDSGSSNMVADVSQNFVISGLNADTDYDLYFVVEDQSQQFSDIIDQSFTTRAIVTWYEDSDDDGFGNGATSMMACDQPTGYVNNNEDCDDSDAGIHPNATEIVGNNIDDNCDGNIDELVYCIPSASEYACDYMYISNVSTSGGVTNFNNSTQCSNTSFSDYSSSQSVSQLQGSVVNLNFASYGYGLKYSVWVDYNNDGIFSGSEMVINGSGNNGSFSIPANASIGDHRMRIRGDYEYNATIGDPCSTLQYGETEDYTLNVTASTPADLTSISASDSTICLGSSTILTANGTSGEVYWYTESCGGTLAGIGDTLTVTPATTTTYYAKNFNGSFSDGCASVTINTTTPTAIAQDITIQLDANGEASITSDDVNNGSFANCTFTTSLDTTSFNCSNVGNNSVTLLVTDVNGNESTAIAVVTVEDNVDPVAITQDISVSLDANGTISITPEMIDNDSNDACGIASLSLDIDTFTCDNVGVNEVILTVTDSNGNVSTATANVTVSDVTDPTVITQNYSVTLANGIANITADDINDGSFDNCEFTLSIDRSDFNCDDIGDHTITLTATDASGNSSSNTAIVSVLGDVPTIAIEDFTAVQTQSDNTIFLGFGPQSINLSTVVTGGSGFTYEWTTSSGETVSNQANPSISPTVSTTYDVTVTNSNGCTASTSVYICVIDARAFDNKGRYKGKVRVCHHTNGKKGTKHVEINISPSAVMTHLTKHGVGTDHPDTLGGCDAVCVDSDKAISNQNVNSTSIEDNLLIYPNPSNGVFDIKLTALNLQTEVLLFNTIGKLIERKSISKENSGENIITIGNNNLTSGIYILKIITKNETITKKVIIGRE